MELTPKMRAAVAAIRANSIGLDYHAAAMLGATLEAYSLGISEVTAVEFGVANGGGLLDICGVADYLTESFGIRFRIFGFDTAAGLPAIKDYRDHPEIWAAGQYPMGDHAALRQKLPSHCKLIIGDITETVVPFCQNNLNDAAPLAFIKMDVDYYSSTLAALEILKHRPSCYLPVVFSYFDDTEYWITYNRWCGERGAIEEFNRVNTLRKIDKMNVRLYETPRRHWHDKIYGCHILDHPTRTGAVPVPHQLQINTADDF